MPSVENEIRKYVQEFNRGRRRRRRQGPTGGLKPVESSVSAKSSLITPPPEEPLCSVIICTRDRPADLAICLDSIARLKGNAHEVIVVDNAPSTAATQRLVKGFQGGLPLRYVLEPRAGLDIARNRGVMEARGEIVAFTDDDCVVDEYWVEALVPHFANPQVGVVTGFVPPWELETRAQELFEFKYGGMSRGLLPYSTDFTRMKAVQAGRLGAGANMSFRKRVLLDLGLFNEALDCGMPTKSGGDSYALYKVLSAGYRADYEPNAIVWHRHRRGYQELKKQMYGYGVGVSAWLTACLVEDHDLEILRFALNWFRYWHFPRLYRGLRRRIDFPLDLIFTEFKGSLVGPVAYFRAKKVAAESRRMAESLPNQSPVLAARYSEADCEDVG